MDLPVRWCRNLGRRSAAALATLFLGGCGGRDQSALSPHGDAAHKIADLWWVMLVASTLIFAVVLVLIVVAFLRRRGAEAPVERRRGGAWIPAVGGLIVPIFVLVALFALTLHTLPGTSAAAGKTAFTIDVTGRQWFWDVTYPGRRIRTANELHIPVGVPVRLQVSSGDVIHSFWVPELNRKIDMIPGKTNTIRLEADRAGTFRGQCAEFCGLQHAHMAFDVVAQPQADFDRWASSQAAIPPQPATPELKLGQEVLLGSACVYCHAIAGTNASGKIGPDLTHVGSRLTLGAGTIPNSRGYLAGWILDPQHVKPGNRMPGTDLTGEELQSLLDYLESLK